jgi:DNA-binding beta-propeller fold protein YncE
MKRFHAIVVVGLAAAVFVFAARGITRLEASAATREVTPLLQVEEIPLPGVAGRFDHLTFDLRHLRLILCALGNNTLEIVDIVGGRAVRSMPGLSAPQGVAYIPAFDKLVVSNAGDRTVRIYEGADYALRRAHEFGGDADSIKYDSDSKRVLVAYGGDGSGAIGMIDIATNERAGNDIHTAGGGHPEGFELETKGSRIFANVPGDGAAVEVFDRKTSGLLAKWVLNGASENHAIALDEASHRLFTFPRQPPLMLVLDTETGKEVARLPAVGDPDDAFFDKVRKRIYVTGSQGFINVFQEKDADQYDLIQSIPTGVGARTSYLLAFGKRARFYVAVPATANQPARILSYEAQD